MNHDLVMKENLITKMMGYILPDRMKRIIFISSFIGQIKDCKNPDMELLSKINNLLTLSTQNNQGAVALAFPMKMHSVLWDKVELKEIFLSKNIHIDDVRQIAEYKFVKNQVRLVSEELVKRTPRWLRYSSNTQMRSDLMLVFNNMGNLLQTKATA